MMLEYRTVRFAFTALVALGLGACASQQHRLEPGAKAQVSADTPAAFEALTELHLDRFQERISRLEERRDRLDEGTAQYRQMQTKLNAIQGKMAEAQANLRALDDAPTNAWEGYKSAINKNLAELDRMIGTQTAE
jgi:exonuclease VII small subunit